MIKFEKAIIEELEQLRKEFTDLKAEIEKQRVKSDFCTKADAMEIMGWGTTPYAGLQKLWLLRSNGILSKPSHAPTMYITAEVEKAKKDFGKKFTIKRRNQQYFFIKLKQS